MLMIIKQDYKLTAGWDIGTGNGATVTQHKQTRCVLVKINV